MTEKLKPCPWCREDVELWKGTIKGTYEMFHKNKDSLCAFFEPIVITADTRKEAIEKWNRRAE